MSRNFESNGPDVKIRGNAAHIAEKYMSLARDATSSGDRVMAENYLQHAEHYNRIVAAAIANSNRGDDHSFAGRGPQPDFSDDDGDDEDEAGGHLDNRKDREVQARQQQQHVRNRQPSENREQMNGPSAPESTPQETKPSNGAEQEQPENRPERQSREQRGRRRPRRSEAAATNSSGDDVTGGSSAADAGNPDGRSDISSDAAKLPGNLLGVDHGYEVSSGASSED